MSQLVTKGNKVTLLDDECRAVLQVVDYAEASGQPLTVDEFQGSPPDLRGD